MRSYELLPAVDGPGVEAGLDRPDGRAVVRHREAREQRTHLGVGDRVRRELPLHPAREAEPAAATEPGATPAPPEAPEAQAVLEIRAALAESNAALAEVVRAITDMDARLQLLERSEQQRREAWLADLPALQPRELVRPRDARPAEAISEVPSSERVKQVLTEKGIA